VRVKLGRDDRITDLYVSFVSLFRENKSGILSAVSEPGPVRDILRAWIMTARNGFEVQSLFNFGLRASFGDALLPLARELMNEPADSPYWIRPGQDTPNPYTRDSVLRGAIATVRDHGGPEDIPVLMALRKEVPEIDPNKDKPIYRTSFSDAAFGVLLKLNGLIPADFLLEERDGRQGFTYSFKTYERQGEGLTRFDEWLAFLSLDAPGSVPENIDSLDRQAALEMLIRGRTRTEAAKRRAVARLMSEPRAAMALLGVARKQASGVPPALSSGLRLRLETALADRVIGGEPDDDRLLPARERFEEVIGEEGLAFFERMKIEESGLLTAYADYLSASEETRDFYRDVVELVFMRRENELVNRFERRRIEFDDRQIAAGRRPRQPDIIYPPNLEDRFFARLATATGGSASVGSSRKMALVEWFGSQTTRF
ncbi:MAG: hypothetical protein AAF492_25705, partial [Verrucomicrobiota bacterium]